MTAVTPVVVGDGDDAPDIAWIIAAHEAGRADPDPFYTKGTEQ